MNQNHSRSGAEVDGDGDNDCTLSAMTLGLELYTGGYMFSRGETLLSAHVNIHSTWSMNPQTTTEMLELHENTTSNERESKNYSFHRCQTWYIGSRNPHDC